MIFVNSMSDLFHEKVPDEYILAVIRVMQLANWHTYQVLTKRSKRMRDILRKQEGAASASHIWWGVSVENRKYGLPRIGHLQESQAGVRFLSVEPLLEDLGEIALGGIDWVIVGGESGHGARPMSGDWVLNIRDQCLRDSVPFFFKQWGGVRKSINGRVLEGKTYNEFPPQATMPIKKGETLANAIAEIKALEGSAMSWSI
jgi:protein gp37